MKDNWNILSIDIDTDNLKGDIFSDNILENIIGNYTHMVTKDIYSSVVTTYASFSNLLFDNHEDDDINYVSDFLRALSKHIISVEPLIIGKIDTHAFSMPEDEHYKVISFNGDIFMIKASNDLFKGDKFNIHYSILDLNYNEISVTSEKLMKPIELINLLKEKY